MKKLFALIICTFMIFGTLPIAVNASTLDSYAGDSWNAIRINLGASNNRNVVCADETLTLSQSNSSGFVYWYTSPTADNADLLGSYIEKTITLNQGTYEVSLPVSYSSIVNERLEIYSENGTLLCTGSDMTSANRVSTAILDITQSTQTVKVRVVSIESSVANQRYRIGGCWIYFNSTNNTAYTSKHIDADKAYAGTSAGGNKSITNSGSTSVLGAEHIGCSFDVGSGKHNCVGAVGCNVGDYVYYKFTDIPAGIYTIEDKFYDVSQKSSWDVYTGNDTDNLTATGTGLVSKGNTSIKAITSENITVDESGVLIYACKFTNGTDGNCRTVHFCFGLTKTAELPDADPLAVDVKMVEGAAIRLNCKTGIRFYATVDTAKINTLKANSANVEMGILISPADVVEGLDLTRSLDENYYIDVPFVKNGFYYDNGALQNGGIVASIVDILESNSYSKNSGNITRAFVARAYVSVTLGDTTTVSYANNYLNTSRSVKYIANAIVQNEPNGEAYKAHKADIDRWAAAIK